MIPKRRCKRELGKGGREFNSRPNGGNFSRNACKHLPRQIEGAADLVIDALSPERRERERAGLLDDRAYVIMYLSDRQLDI